MSVKTLVPWGHTELLALPANAQPPAIAQHAVLLSQRDKSALVMAFDNEAYEMAATFVWSKAIAALKKQLATLGMEFVGEMLGRTDLNEASNPITDIREDEAIELAEQLGMVSTTEAIRLRNGQTLVNHFLDPEVSHGEQMHREEAISVVRSCVVNFLADGSENVRQPFVDLRKKLESETLQADGPEVESLATSPYFFVRTTLTVLLTQLKLSTGAKLEHAAGNINVLLPAMWPKLRDKDRWQTGETYAIIQASGTDRPVAAAGLRQALLRVNGFDLCLKPCDLKRSGGLHVRCWVPILRGITFITSQNRWRLSPALDPPFQARHWPTVSLLPSAFGSGTAMGDPMPRSLRQSVF
jgi:hypothetical protein